ncbi:MAG: sigma-70 family RNA polymerase sigma factor [Verrucomicrobiota bacterium]
MKKAELESTDIFNTTRWSVVLGAWEGNPEDQMTQLNVLARAYWDPLMIYAKSLNKPPVEPEDLVQSFFEKILQRESFGEISPDRGRFRAFLLRSFRNHVTDVARKKSRAKRGGKTQVLPLSEIADPPGPDEAPGSQFDRAWAHTLMNIVLDRLRASYYQSDKQALYDTLHPYLNGGPNLPTYEEKAAELNMTRGAVVMSVRRMRDKFGVILREEVGKTVASPSDINEEMAYLLGAITE